MEGGGFLDCDEPTTVVTSAEIAIDKDVILDGRGNLTVDGNLDHRVFSVPVGVTALLAGLTVTRGTVRGGGAGILNEGRLFLRSSTVSGNTALNDGPINPPTGSGIHNNQGALTMENTTVSGNTARGGGPGVFSSGGVLTMTNCTVSGNISEGAVGVGGIYVAGGMATLTNSTISGNTGSDVGGILNSHGTLILNHSTVSGNTGGVDGLANDDPTLFNTIPGTLFVMNSLVDGDCIGSIASAGGNIEPRRHMWFRSGNRPG